MGSLFSSDSSDSSDPPRRPPGPPSPPSRPSRPSPSPAEIARSLEIDRLRAEQARKAEREAERERLTRWRAEEARARFVRAVEGGDAAEIKKLLSQVHITDPLLLARAKDILRTDRARVDLRSAIHGEDIAGLSAALQEARSRDVNTQLIAHAEHALADLKYKAKVASEAERVLNAMVATKDTSKMVWALSRAAAAGVNPNTLREVRFAVQSQLQRELDITLKAGDDDGVALAEVLMEVLLGGEIRKGKRPRHMSHAGPAPTPSPASVLTDLLQETLKLRRLVQASFGHDASGKKACKGLSQCALETKLSKKDIIFYEVHRALLLVHRMRALCFDHMPGPRIESTRVKNLVLSTLFKRLAVSLGNAEHAIGNYCPMQRCLQMRKRMQDQCSRSRCIAESFAQVWEGACVLLTVAPFLERRLPIVYTIIAFNVHPLSHHRGAPP